MASEHTYFTILSGVGAFILIPICVHFLFRVHKNNGKRSVDPLVAKCATVSLFGYTIFVILSFIFYLIQSLYYIPGLDIDYTMLLCEAQTFNIAFFMTGKLANYFYFMTLVHVAFRSSFLAYNPKILFGIASLFLVLMLRNLSLQISAPYYPMGRSLTFPIH